MRKIRAEMPSNPQQNDLGMESKTSPGLDVATITRGVCAVAAGRVISGCVFFMFTVGAGLGRMVIRAVSFFGPGWTAAPLSRLSTFPFPGRAGVLPGPAGFGKGVSRGEAATSEARIGGIGGLGNEVGGETLAESSGEDGGWIVGGNRRTGAALTGVRDGRTIRAVSRFTVADSGDTSGLGGNAMRTVSFLGSAIMNILPRRVAEIYFFVTR
ncbi:MAG TPA: hypothetical protein VGI42_05410 [Chthoniobacterales bacterium]|jgi:hypothetical protein